MAIDSEREDWVNATVIKAYTYTLALLADLTEEERRYALIALAMYILEGISISMRASLMSGDLKNALENDDAKQDH